MSIRIIKINSSAISGAKYDVENQLLKIQFKGNSQWYSSFSVPEYVINEFEEADSQGQYWNSNIKNNYT